MKLVDLKKSVEKIGNLMSKKNNSQTLMGAINSLIKGIKEVNEFGKSVVVDMGACEGKIEKTSIGIEQGSETYRRTTMKKENRTVVSFTVVDDNVLKTSIVVDVVCELYHERQKINLQDIMTNEVVYFEKEFTLPGVTPGTTSEASSLSRLDANIKNDNKFLDGLKDIAPYRLNKFKEVAKFKNILKEENSLESLVKFNTAALGLSISDCQEYIYVEENYDTFPIFKEVQNLVVENTMKVLDEVVELQKQGKEINEDMIFCLEVAKIMYTGDVTEDDRVLNRIAEICILTKMHKDTCYRTNNYANVELKNNIEEINEWVLNYECEDEESFECLQELGKSLGIDIYKNKYGELVVEHMLVQIPGQVSIEDILTTIEDEEKIEVVEDKPVSITEKRQELEQELETIEVLEMIGRIQKLSYLFYGHRINAEIVSKIKTRWKNYIWNTDKRFETIDESWSEFIEDVLAVEYVKIEETNVGSDIFTIGDTLKVFDDIVGFVTGVVEEIRRYSMPKKGQFYYVVIDGKEYNNFVEKVPAPTDEPKLDKIQEILQYRVCYFTHQAVSKGSGRDKAYLESRENAVTEGKGEISKKQWIKEVSDIIEKYEDQQLYKEIYEEVKEFPYNHNAREEKLIVETLERYIYRHKYIERYENKKQVLVNNSIDVIIEKEDKKEQEDMTNSNKNIVSVNKLIDNIEKYAEEKGKTIEELTKDERFELVKTKIIDKYNTTTSRNLLNIFNKFMEEHGHSSKERIKLTQFKTSMGVDGIYTEEELKEKIKGLQNPQDKFIIWALFKGICGTKAVDLLNLKVEDIDFNENTIKYNGKIIIMDDYFRKITMDAVNQEVYIKNNYIGEEYHGVPDYSLNMNSKYVIKGKPNVKNNNGLNPFGFEGLRRRLSKLGEITESRFGIDLLDRSGMLQTLQKEKTEWTSTEIKNEIKDRGWKASANVLYDLMKEKYNMEKGNRWKNK